MSRRALVAVLFTLLTAAPAAAGTIVIHLTFIPGKLVVRSVPAAATPHGAVRVPVTVADGRGNGNGWTLRVVSSQALHITSITAMCAADSTCTLPTATGKPDGNVVLQADHGTGMGVVDLTVTVAALPAGTAPAKLVFSAN